MSRYETPDPVPAYPHVGLTRKKSMAEQIREMVRSERLAQAAAAEGHETFEEADDFDVGEDIDPHSEYEEVFEPEVYEDSGLDRRLVSALRTALGIKEDEGVAAEGKTDEEKGGDVEQQA